MPFPAGKLGSPIGPRTFSPSLCWSLLEEFPQPREYAQDMCDVTSKGNMEKVSVCKVYSLMSTLCPDTRHTLDHTSLDTDVHGHITQMPKVAINQTFY